MVAASVKNVTSIFFERMTSLRKMVLFSTIIAIFKNSEKTLVQENPAHYAESKLGL